MISLIVAHSDQNVIGFKGGMPWYLPNDLNHVKKLTENNTIVMGRRTLESIGKPLPNRKNVVLTRNREFTAEGVEVIHDIAGIHQLEGEVFIFGGSNIYGQTMHLVDEMHITRIHEAFAGDTFFPEYDPSLWHVHSREDGKVDARNKYPHEFIHYSKNQK